MSDLPTVQEVFSRLRAVRDDLKQTSDGLDAGSWSKTNIDKAVTELTEIGDYDEPLVAHIEAATPQYQSDAVHRDLRKLIYVAPLNERVLAQAVTTISEDFKRQAGMELTNYSYSILATEGDELEMVLVCYARHEGFGGGGYYFTIYAGEDGKLKNIVSFPEGEPYNITL